MTNVKNIENDLRRINLINVDLWNKAKWRGLGYFYLGQELVPGLTLACENRTPAEKLFRDLVARIGEDDSKGLLRICFVEGDIPGEDPGYTVLIGTDIDSMLSDLHNKGQPLTSPLTSFIYRPLRCGLSDRLEQFKMAFEKHKQCVLKPGDMTGKNFEGHHIIVHNVVFRRAEEIGRDDPDFAAFTLNGPPPGPGVN